MRRPMIRLPMFVQHAFACACMGLFVYMLVRDLRDGNVSVGKWGAFIMERDVHPTGYWISIGVNSVIVLVGAVVIIRAMVRGSYSRNARVE